MTKLNKTLVNIAIVVISTLLTFWIVEKVYRKLIFSKKPAFAKFQDPGIYADPESEDAYWLMLYYLNENVKPPQDPHPLLGWIDKCNRKTYVHGDIDKLKNKRPVLLFGDSFAQCVDASECFEDILNTDPEFSKNHHLLNYGIGGYGVDQIYLLTKQVYPHYRKPFVIFSLMVTDLDRSILTFRTGQKPYFEIVNDSLVLKGVPINPDPVEFIESQKIKIRSFLFRKFLSSPYNFLSPKLTSKLKKEKKYLEKKEKINEKILVSLAQELKGNNIDFVFLIFNILRYGNDNYGENSVDAWRHSFLKKTMDINNIPYIWTLDLVENDTMYDKNDIPKYLLPGDGHPTTHFNKLISREIKSEVLKTYAIYSSESDNKYRIDTNYFEDRINFNMQKIYQNDTILNYVQKWALEKGKTLDEMVEQFSVYLTFEGKDPYKQKY